MLCLCSGHTDDGGGLVDQHRGGILVLHTGLVGLK